MSGDMTFHGGRKGLAESVSFVTSTRVGSPAMIMWLTRGSERHHG